MDNLRFSFRLSAIEVWTNKIYVCLIQVICYFVLCLRYSIQKEYFMSQWSEYKNTRHTHGRQQVVGFMRLSLLCVYVCCCRYGNCLWIWKKYNIMNSFPLEAFMPRVEYYVCTAYIHTHIYIKHCGFNALLYGRCQCGCASYAYGELVLASWQTTKGNLFSGIIYVLNNSRHIASNARFQGCAVGHCLWLVTFILREWHTY